MNIYLVFAFVFLFYIVAPTICVLCIKNYKALKILSYIFLALFVCVLVVGVFGKVSIGKTVAVSFNFNGSWFSKNFNFVPYTRDLQDILINITMLVPVGIFCAVNFKHKILWAFLFGLFFGIGIEFLQFALPIIRSPQLSDVILNTISSGVGGLFGVLLLYIRNKIYLRK